MGKKTNKKSSVSLEASITPELLQQAKNIHKNHGRPERVTIYLSYKQYKAMMQQKKYRKLFGEEK